MLKFEDDRTARQRANVRTLRRTVLRLTLQLPRDTWLMTPEFRNILSRSSSGEIVLRVDLHDRATRQSNDEQSSFDEPVCKWVKVTRGWLLALIELMLRRGYALSYIKRALFQIRSDARHLRAFPLNDTEFRAFIRSIIVTKTDHFSGHRLQTDGVYAMTDEEYETMRTFAWQTVRAALDRRAGLEIVTPGSSQLAYTDRPFKRSEILFAYIYLMMFHTGKRAGELSNLTRDELRLLLERGDIAIRIPKTERIGRLSLSRIERTEEFQQFLRAFLELTDRESTLTDVVPFEVNAQRRMQNARFAVIYERLFNRKKPRGLSFHSLRRRKAARFYKSGESLESIRECLDHKNARMTNVYINKHLLSETQRPGTCTPSGS